MTDLDRQVLEAIKAKPGQKAKDIAAQLSVDRNLLNSTLHGSLRGKVQQDRNYDQEPPTDGAGLGRDEVLGLSGSGRS